MHSPSVSVSGLFRRSVQRGSFLLFSLGILFFSVSTGCTRQEGTLVSPMSMAELHEGKSTMDDVRRILGRPDRVKSLLGDQTWIYRHTQTTGWFSQDMKVNEVWILFSSEGIVRQIRVQKYQGSQLF